MDKKEFTLLEKLEITERQNNFIFQILLEHKKKINEIQKTLEKHGITQEKGEKTCEARK